MSSLITPEVVGDRAVVAAIGGGHGLSATLTALCDLPVYPVAVVGTADDGSSSGRLRRIFPCVPPGDMRMAFGALLADAPHADDWRALLHERFAPGTPLAGHAIGNLVLTAMLLRTDPVAAMAQASRLLGLRGIVVPACDEALELIATVRHDHDDSGEPFVVRGQGTIATTIGEVESVRFEPLHADAPAAVRDTVRESSAIIMGPGSWWTSVIPPLLLPGLRAAVVDSTGLRILLLNLGAQPGETTGYTPSAHLHVFGQVLPEIRIDVVVADPRTIDDRQSLEAAAAELGGVVEYGEVGLTRPDGSISLAHDPAALAAVLERVLDRHGRIKACR